MSKEGKMEKSFLNFKVSWFLRPIPPSHSLALTDEQQCLLLILISQMLVLCQILMVVHFLTTLARSRLQHGLDTLSLAPRLSLSPPTSFPHAKNFTRTPLLLFAPSDPLLGHYGNHMRSVFVGGASRVDPTRPDRIFVPQSDGGGSRAI